MMDENKLNASLDGELSDDEQKALEQLLSESSEARQEWGRLKAQDEELEEFFASLELDSKTEVKARPWGFLKLAAGLVLGFGIGYVVFSQEESKAPSTESPSTNKNTSEMKSDESRNPENWARLVVSTGDVFIRPTNSTEYVALLPENEIQPGSTLKTSEAARCTLELRDGTAIRLERKSEIELLSSRTITLLAGRLMASVSASPQGPAFASAGLSFDVTGARFDLLRTGDDLELTVLEGEAKAGEKTIPAGHRARAKDGEIERIGRVRDLPLVTTWMHELLALEGGDRDELHARVRVMLAQLGRTKMELLYEWEIRSLGENCVVPLVMFLASTSADEERGRRRVAAGIVADLAGAKHLESLLELLEDEDASVRWSGVRGLRRVMGRGQGFDEAFWQGENRERGIEHWRDAIRRARAGERF